jgi:hypothetical protein
VNRTEYIGKLNALYVGEKNCLEELITAYDEKGKEIERLKERIEDLNIINEEHQILNGMIRKELQQKENIIKEVREYIEKNYIYIQHVTYNKLLEILDKVEDKKIEKVNNYVLCDYDFKNKDDDNNLIATNIIDKAFEEYSHKINEIIDKLNEMEKE